MVSVRDIVKKFEANLKIIDGKKNIDNQILKPGINRVGFELSGVFIDRNIKNIVVLGNREYTYLMGLNTKEQAKRLNGILNLKPPMILLTKSFETPDILISANKNKQIPIVSSDMFSNDISFSIGSFVSEMLVEYQTIHGVLLEIYGEGVLLTGESGIGKSEIAMEMIKKNHMFIADDAVDVCRFGAGVIGKANKLAKNFIEVRGLGILNITKMYGIEKVKSTTELTVGIELVNIRDTKYEFERLGTKLQTKIICGIHIPWYILPVSSGRKVGDLIESVVIDLKLKQEGYNSAEDFLNQKNIIMKNSTKPSSYLKSRKPKVKK